ADVERSRGDAAHRSDWAPPPASSDRDAQPPPPRPYYERQLPDRVTWVGRPFAVSRNPVPRLPQVVIAPTGAPLGSVHRLLLRVAAALTSREAQAQAWWKSTAVSPRLFPDRTICICAELAASLDVVVFTTTSVLAPFTNHAMLCANTIALAFAIWP